MQDHSDDKGRLRAPGEGRRITRAEMMDVLADEGYSGDQRKGWLKQVLTDLTGEDADPSDPDRARLVREIRSILGEQLPETPIAEDGLKPDP